MMTHPPDKALLAALVPLLDDLSRAATESDVYRRLPEVLRWIVSCDACALLRCDGAQLTPLAVGGLSPDTLGRRFRLDEQPRLRILLDARGPNRFEADCTLPDPYDGLVVGQAGKLEVHDCMGCPVFLETPEEKTPWGLLTFDALDAGRFAAVDLESLRILADFVAALVRHVRHLEKLRDALRQRAEIQDAGQEDAAASLFDTRELIGESAVFRQMQDEIRLIADSDLAVLLGGETGAGKELVADAIHRQSPRRRQPMISLNCAALPETLVESELFGHVRGAFSGAVQERRGKFELADGGTLFLDEVGELPLAIQAKLLRVLQSGQLQRLGSDREHRVDVRLIAATNRDLAAEVRAGHFRADLYHRLGAYPLRVPPLRERGNDILLLAGHFLERNRPRLGLRGLCLSAAAQMALLHYDWPGNVRELEHLIGRACLRALAANSTRPRILMLDVGHLGLDTVPPGNANASAETPLDDQPECVPIGPLRPALDTLQRRMIAASLERHPGNRAAAARELGLDRANLNRLIRRLRLLEQ
ncbi:MAG: nitric oxide reductase transcriptional regulator NorR [Zoogloeaceae bacterium]|jgi:anaerobic nitric oxide reductase transcription regulator|nr:nitric oxide reductase transcriptional regulator NorR [Zoogloeaceae bacterium]